MDWVLISIFGLLVIPQKYQREFILSAAITMERRHVFSDPLKEHKPHLNFKESFELNHKDFMRIICTQCNTVPTRAYVGIIQYLSTNYAHKIFMIKLKGLLGI